MKLQFSILTALAALATASPMASPDAAPEPLPEALAQPAALAGAAPDAQPDALRPAVAAALAARGELDARRTPKVSNNNNHSSAALGFSAPSTPKLALGMGVGVLVWGLVDDLVPV